MILIFSHTLTEIQEEDARENLGIDEFIYLPTKLQELWSSLPPNVEDLSNITKRIKEWASDLVNKDDYILVQGDFGATYDVVYYLKQRGLKVVYSTTSRQAIESKKADGSLEITRVFDHVIFREYKN